ncbi:alpha-mannosidase 2x-like [Amphibalanus amphitrite]|uniref:alpha-mannosidase 2x-like n=1 Tax=Amphibalanus amphitrite TaxID=1232801 RepID=UPI001C91D14E|nr:alpha-mannosidase 2x-like [Amphibalanus amphitrite]
MEAPSRWLVPRCGRRSARCPVRRPSSLLLAGTVFYCCLVVLLLSLMDVPPPETAPTGHRLRLRRLATQRPEEEVCHWPKRKADVDIDLQSVLTMLNLSRSSTEDRSSFWNDDLERRYRKISKNSSFPLKILVVPLSRPPDQCRRLTLVSCHLRHTHRVLDTLVQMMPQMPQMRFTWSDISLLQLWWEGASKARRGTLRQLAASGRLEIANGGWVMADGAVTRLYPLLDQLTEGHRWVHHHLNVTVSSGWSLTSAGHSSTLSYLLRAAGLNGASILKTSLRWKEYFASHQQGDFLWRQEWDITNSDSLLTHIQPQFTDYLADSCRTFGIASKACEELDFSQNSPVSDVFNSSHCLTNSKLKRLTERLVDLGGRIGSLSRHNVALLTLGGDMRFEKESSWRSEYRAFRQLSACLASRPELRAELRLATPADYFSEVRRWSSADGGAGRLPSLSGELHEPGAPGRYSRLPEWLRAARQLEAHLHAAELMFVWSWSRHREPRTLSVFQHAYKRLTMNRQDVGLFSDHHIASGAVAPYVMADYGERLNISQQDLTHVQLTAAAELLSDLEFYNQLTELFAQHSPPQLDRLGEPPQPVEFTVLAGQRRRLLIFNPVAQQRTALVSLLVRRPGITVTDDAGRSLPLQVTAGGDSTVRVQFLARLEPVALHLFLVQRPAVPPSISPVLSEAELNETFVIDSARFQLTFDKSAGLVTVLDRRTGQRQPMGLGVGALADADRRATLLQPLRCSRNSWTVQSGVVLSEARVTCGRVRLAVRLYHSNCTLGQAVHIEVETRPPSEAEPRDVALVLRTDLQSCEPRGCGFYADANDYRMVWRPHLPATDAAAQFYPVTTQVSLEDSHRRVSLLMDHSRGVASFKEGSLTAVLDADSGVEIADGGGSSLGDHERRPVLASFALTFEYLPETESDAEPVSERLFAPGALSSSLARLLSHPPVVQLSDDPWPPPVRSPLRLLDGSLPCGWELLTLRQLPELARYEVPGEGAQLTLLRRQLDCRLTDQRDGLGCPSAPADSAQVDFHPPLQVLQLQETTLTGGRLDPPPAELRRLRDVRLAPDEVRSFRVKFVSAKRATTTSHRPDYAELALVRRLNKLEDDDVLL